MKRFTLNKYIYIYIYLYKGLRKSICVINLKDNEKPNVNK